MTRLVSFVKKLPPLVKCPRCGFHQPAGLHQCRMCGEPIREAA